MERIIGADGIKIAAPLYRVNLMKKAIGILFLAQLIVLSIYGMIVFNHNILLDVLGTNEHQVLATFPTNDEFEDFLTRTKYADVEISRAVLTDSNTIELYTSDLTLNGRISLMSGEWPQIGSGEFISNFRTEESSNVGQFHDILPSYRLLIRNIDDMVYVGTGGVYTILASDSFTKAELSQLLNQLFQESFVDASIATRDEGFVELIMHTLLGGFYSYDSNEMILFLLVNFLVFLCTVIALISDGITKLKLGSILKTHGYSSTKIIRAAISDSLKCMLAGMLIAYLLLVIYAVIASYAFYLGEISALFIIGAFCLIIAYLLIYVLFVTIYLKITPLISILKGRVPYKIPQALNIISKTVLMFAVSLALVSIADSLNDINYRMRAASNWTLAENVFRINIAEIGQLSDFATEEKVLDGIVPVYDELVTKHLGFIVDSTSIRIDDMRGRTNELNNFEEIMRGSLTVSPNYLRLNPVLSIDDNDVLDLIVEDEYVLNILIPSSLSEQAEKIVSAFTDWFHFQVDEVPNIYNHTLDRPLIEVDKELLQINVIEVRDGQQYFAFHESTKLQEGNMLQDVVVMVYTRNFHPSFIYSMFTHSFYYYTESTDAFGIAHSIFFDNNLGSLLHSVESAYDTYGEAVLRLQEGITRNILIIIVLLFTYVIFSYNFANNYINKNKSRLFVKKTLGFSAIKRNQVILISISILIILGAAIIYSFVGFYVILLGALLTVCDVIVLLILENKQLAKYYSEIQKGWI